MGVHKVRFLDSQGTFDPQIRLPLSLINPQPTPTILVVQCQFSAALGGAPGQHGNQLSRKRHRPVGITQTGSESPAARAYFQRSSKNPECTIKLSLRVIRA